MFAKIDKKVLIISIVALVIVLLAGLFVFRYLSQIKGTDMQNSLQGASVENSVEEKSNAGGDNQGNQTEVPQVQIQADGIQSQGGNNGGGLTVCLDKCGDGTCQETDPNCTDKSINCICPETIQECPQDCK